MIGKTSIALLALSAAFFALPKSAKTQNLLINGDLESDDIPGWTLAQTATGIAGSAVNSAEVRDFANHPALAAGESGLWLRPFAGNLGTYYGGLNAQTNAVLSQTVLGVPGDEYSFSGWSLFESNFAGGLTTLDAGSPSGAVASPTTNQLELAFLDASDAVIGAPLMLDVRNDRVAQIGSPFANDGSWRQHTLTGIAPVGTTRIRVTAAGTNMVANIDPMQSAFYDDFKLAKTSLPSIDLLTNGNLNAPSALAGWTITESPLGNDSLEVIEFAHRPATAGSLGVWLKPFNSFPTSDAVLSQTVAGVAGLKYTFSGGSAFEPFYSGANAASSTDTFLELAFLDSLQQLIGAPISLELAEAGQITASGAISDHPEAWRNFSVSGVAPSGTAFVRVRAGATGMFPGAGDPQSAFFDDLVLTAVPEPGTVALAAWVLIGFTLGRRFRCI